jgi:hypothetical protein
MRMNRRPIASMRRSCSDSPPTASQLDGVFGSDRGQFDQLADEIDPLLYEVAHVMDSGE